MREQLDQRLKQLKAEFEAGQKVLAEVEAKQANIREAMLRISGAIQVLEELRAGAASEGAYGTGAAEQPRQLHGPSVGYGGALPVPSGGGNGKGYLP